MPFPAQRSLFLGLPPAPKLAICMLLDPKLPRYSLHSLYRVPLFPKGQQLRDHNQCLLHTQMQSVPESCSPWKAMQMELRGSIHPGSVVNSGPRHRRARDQSDLPPGGYTGYTSGYTARSLWKENKLESDTPAPGVSLISNLF